MSHTVTFVEKLTRLLDALEHDVLHQASATFAARDPDASAIAESVRAALRESMLTRAQPVDSSSHQTSKRTRGRQRQFRTPVEQLRELVRLRPDVAPVLVAVFASGARPDARQVEEAMKIFRGLGVVGPKDEPSD